MSYLRVVEEDPTLESHEGHARMTPHQLRVVLSTALITIALAGIRGGKTHAGAMKELTYALSHPCTEDEVHLVLAPTYTMSNRPVEKIFKLLYDKKLFPICPLIKYIKSERSFLLACEDGRTTKIQVASLHDPNRIRGIKALSAWIDEGAYISQEAWDIVQGRLADTNGPCWITTTPAGYNWVFDLYDQAVKGAKHIKVIHWPSTENIFASAEGLGNLIQRYDPKTYQQEVQARFVRGSGLCYYTFNRFVHLKKGVVNRSLPLWVGQDFNVNPMCSVIGQPFKTPEGEEGVHILKTRSAPNSDTFGLVTFLDNFIREHRIEKKQVTIYADAAGNARSTAGKSDFQILRGANYRVDASLHNPLVKDRINCVNGLFQPLVSKYPRILINDDIHDLVNDLEKQAWDPDTDPPAPDKTKGYDHRTDALGYLCWKRWPLKTLTQLARSAA